MQSKILNHLLRPASLSLLLLTLAGAKAQNADDFFHGGAQSYLSNNIPAALAVVTNGLQRFPDDQKLQKLYELLNQQQQQQQQQSEQQDQSKQDQQEQSKEDQKEQQEDQDKQNQSQPDQQQAKSSEGEESDPQESQPDQAQPAQARAMTPQEAKQLLDAQKGEERVLQFRPPAEPPRRNKLLKDW